VNLLGEKFFFLGVGGMGMLPLALFAAEGGAIVEGFDDGMTPRAESILRRAGIGVHQLIPDLIDCSVLVISSAIRRDHPVFQRLRSGERTPSILRRGELLARIAKNRRFVAVAGSHGKTTTTALLAHLTSREGVPADFVIGGIPNEDLMPAGNGNNEWLIAEVDESDGTIEGFSPEVTVFLNFDWDHADRYRSRDEMREAWTRLAERTTGTVIHPATSSGEMEPDWRRVENRKTFDDSSPAFGVRNSEAARLAFSIVADRFPSMDPLVGFPGVWRRQTIHICEPDFAVVEDYAHHPREVSAFLEWMNRQDFPLPHRVFFQPHRFSRTTRFVAEFVEALSGLQEVSLHSIYGAGEDPETESDPLAAIREGLEERGVRVTKVGTLGDFSPLVGTFAFVGAGDANEWAPVLASLRKTKSPLSALAAIARTFLGSEEVRENEPLSSHSTLRVGGPAAIWACPGSLAGLRALLRTAALLEVPVEFLGNGSNLLVSDEGFNGLVVHLGGDFWESKTVTEDGECMEVGAGVLLPTLARWAAGNGFRGFSFMEGIPGSVGGGVRMNAGSMGACLAERVVRIDTVDRKGRLQSFGLDELSFGYRSCPQLDGLCIIRAVFRIEGTERPESLREEMRAFSARRRASQPGGPSAGCLFRNPEGESAGRLIDAVGLKGFSVGGVSISEKHANFVQPRSGAAAGDVVQIMRTARKAVGETFGIILEPEVKFLGPNGIRPVFSEGVAQKEVASDE
tara:strand:+ start:1533 stop:3752 length:2220 start_codon:yes stop_codon:yes gene_type:complete